ncbi:uncharacterized protein An15g04970 [Aspergillus niger]|uniref:Contig An15c0180, genomic contig n=2 Tax=Aspergillus niger TaxID=5061 RepID=A2R5N6_ASPNC|nr:uncharacterized protein An15g04970 [Aspergillus niger]CAK42472.1 unnamed protein product [Aspergillus niger]
MGWEPRLDIEHVLVSGVGDYNASTNCPEAHVRMFGFLSLDALKWQMWNSTLLANEVVISAPHISNRLYTRPWPAENFHPRHCALKWYLNLNHRIYQVEWTKQTWAGDKTSKRLKKDLFDPAYINERPRVVQCHRP